MVEIKVGWKSNYDVTITYIDSSPLQSELTKKGGVTFVMLSPLYRGYSGLVGTFCEKAIMKIAA